MVYPNENAAYSYENIFQDVTSLCSSWDVAQFLLSYISFFMSCRSQGSRLKDLIMSPDFCNFALQWMKMYSKN